MPSIPWTTESVNDLINQYKDKKDTSKIVILGRTESAIKGRLRHIALERYKKGDENDETIFNETGYSREQYEKYLQFNKKMQDKKNTDDDITDHLKKMLTIIGKSIVNKISITNVSEEKGKNKIELNISFTSINNVSSSSNKENGKSINSKKESKENVNKETIEKEHVIKKSIKTSDTENEKKKITKKSTSKKNKKKESEDESEDDSEDNSNTD